MNPFANRKYIFLAFILGSGLILIVRLFFIQVVTSSYRFTAHDNTQRKIIQYPARGLIYDRNGELLVSNKASYDVKVTPSQLSEFDTTELCRMLELDKEVLREKLDQAYRYSYYKPSIILKQVSAKTYGLLQERMYKFPGFFVQPRPIRSYPAGIAADVLGYVGEVSEKKVERDDYYKQGDYIGISGIEKTYEESLRGEKGQKVYLVDVHNRIKGSYKNGEFDYPAKVGDNIVTTIDADLQRYGEKLMEGKVGSVVAIQPQSGEVLAMVSSPDYDPERLTGRGRGAYYASLNQDTLDPLFNRALMAKYPPGSTFKPVNALIGLEEEVVYPYTKFYCKNGFYARGVHVGCHDHPTPLDLVGSIQASCNAYYCKTFIRIMKDSDYPDIQKAFTNWRHHLLSMGFGQKMHIDLPNELSGIIPDTNYYNRYYGSTGWSALTILSLAIGQGEIETTPLQMSNMAAAIANRGYYYTPHVVKKIQGSQTIDERYTQPQYTSIDSTYYTHVVEGMDKVVNGPAGSGSTARIASMDTIRICGKTGTAQNPHGDDHSIFVAFAPRNNPQIALSVYVENAGYGSTVAAPIASLMIDQYLTGKVTRTWLENYILEKDFIHNEKED